MSNQQVRLKGLKRQKKETKQLMLQTHEKKKLYECSNGCHLVNL